MQIINNYQLDTCFYSKKLLDKILSLKMSANLDILKIKQAIFYAKKYHGNQKRKSGEPYYSHPLEVAYMILDWSLDSEIIIAALLHDIVEDTKFSLEQITFLFNHNISQLVAKVTNLNDSFYMYRLTEEELILKLTYNEQSKKAILIKLVDRLHNLRTVQYIPRVKQIKKANETVRIYIPLAKYLGITEIENELIELSTNILNTLPVKV